MMRRLLPLVLLALSGCASAAPPGQHERRFEGTIRNHVSMPYLIHVPPGDGPHPVILYLHGGSARGADIAKLRRIGLPARLEKEPLFPFIVISPLLPSGEIWTDSAALIALIDEVLRTTSADRRRVFVTGHSMGGRGALYLAYRHPQRFAAVAAMSAIVPIDHWATRLHSLPVWYFHGAKDSIVPVADGDALVDALRRAGTNVRYSRFEDRDHFILDVYDSNEVFDWFLKQEAR